MQTVMSSKSRSVATTAKVEILDELIAQIDEQLGEGEIDRADLQNSIDDVDALLASLQETMERAQNDIDDLVSERRAKADRKLEFNARLTELEVTLGRFASLDAVYRSDIARLEALEEGGFILSAMSGQDCAVCGAPPSAQRHNHAAEEIQRSHAAAAAEARKIEREQRDLARTVVSLTVEAGGLRTAIVMRARRGRNGRPAPVSAGAMRALSRCIGRLPGAAEGGRRPERLRGLLLQEERTRNDFLAIRPTRRPCREEVPGSDEAAVREVGRQDAHWHRRTDRLRIRKDRPRRPWHLAFSSRLGSAV